MAEVIALETDRLRLRRWRREDFTPFAALNADPRVMEYFPEPLGRTESDALGERIRLLLEQRGWGFWAVEVKGGAPFIGFVGLHVPAPELPCSPCVEVGWRLAHAHWGHGYATEAARAVLEAAFRRIGLAEVVAYTAQCNLPSRRVMERIGMKYAGTFDHPAVPAAHRLNPHVLYRIRADEFDWPAAQPGSAR